MLCFSKNGNIFGDICTNRCPDRRTCTKRRASFLIPAGDILFKEAHTGECDGLLTTDVTVICYAAESYINGVVDHADGLLESSL